MARDLEVRVFDQRAEQMLSVNRWSGQLTYHWAKVPGQQRIELFRLRGPKYVLQPGQPINLGSRRYPQSKFLLPFLKKQYNDLDELLSDMLAHGLFITDYRRLAGGLTHFNDVLPLIERGYVIEDYRRQIILVKREAGKFHDDIWVVDADLVRRLRSCKLLRRDPALKHGCGDRSVYVGGEATLDTLCERQRFLLNHYQASITKSLEEAETRVRLAVEEEARKQCVAALPEVQESILPRREEAEQKSECVGSCLHEDISERVEEPEGRSRRYVMLTPLPGRIEAPAFKKPRRAEPIGRDVILAYDHKGGAITFKEVLAEGRKTPPKGLPPDLMPDAPDDCSDEQWERLMLIEQVKFRRLHGL